MRRGKRHLGVFALMTAATLTLVLGQLTADGAAGPPGGSITGTITESGAPFEGATVSASIAAGVVAQTLSDKNGNYTLNVPAGSYAMSADFSDGVTSCNGGTQLDVRVKNNKTATQNIAITCVSFP